jgi:hypothetical protein
MIDERLSRTAVLVLGMHRSGTSAVTGVMHHLGLELGPSLMQPQDYNPKGFFEHLEIAALHDELLAVFDSTWSDPLSLPEDWVRDPRVRPFQSRLTKIIQQDFSNKPQWGIKDPRLCRLLPLWHQVLATLDITPKAALIVRPPGEVMASLVKRDGMPTEQALMLWLSHYVAAERDSRHLTRTVVFYDDVLADWHSAMLRVRDVLGIDFFAFSHQVTDDLNRFLEAELRHHRGAVVPAPRAPQNEWVSRLYAAMETWRRDDIAPTSIFDQAGEALSNAEKTTSPIASYLRAKAAAPLAAATAARAHFETFYKSELEARMHFEARAQQTGEEVEAQRRKIEMLEGWLHQEEARSISMEQARIAASQQASAGIRQIGRLEVALAEAERLRIAQFEQLSEKHLALDTEYATLSSEYAALSRAHAVVLSSTIWRATLPLRLIGKIMPASLRRALRRAAKLVWWTGTLQLRRKLRQRRTYLQLRAALNGAPPTPVPPQALNHEPVAMRTEEPIVALTPEGVESTDSLKLTESPTEALEIPATIPEPSLVAAYQSLRQRFGSLEPLRTYPDIRSGRRVSIVTDSLNPGLLYGGVATAVVLGALIAQRVGGDLRVISRYQETDPGTVGTLLATLGIPWNQDIECVFSPSGGGGDVPVFAGELFLTTSWWSTRATLSAVSPQQILYLLQEDERMFYPRGDDRLRCAEMLANPEISFAVNSRMLFRHFADGEEALPNIDGRGSWFEPAFPLAQYHDDVASRRSRSKRNFLFYARPNNLRNLYWRGLEAIVAAVEDGTLNREDWNITFVGRDLEPLALPHGLRPTILQNLPWSEYAALVRATDVGLMLIDTPHPSYPPLDLAASGGVAVTNRSGLKTSLSEYSRNIVCVTPTVDELKRGIALAISIAGDENLRLSNYLHNNIQRDWAKTLEATVQRAAGYVH